MNLRERLDWSVSRRSLIFLAGASAATLLAACDLDRGDDDDEVIEPVDEPDDDEPVEDPDEDDEIEEPEPEEDDDVDDFVDDEDDEEPEEPVDVDASVIVDDVIDFTLAPEGRWDGPFGSVTMQLHSGWVNGEDVNFVRTDASDEDFASQHGLVFVPLMANALDEPGSYANIYLFENASDDQRSVLSSSPADGETFSPAFRVHNVSVSGELEAPLMSEQDIQSAAENGQVEIVETDIIVNYPVITWPGGQITVDDEKVEALGGGQFIEDPDFEGGAVTLKLHQCYPGSRYIITDTSALPMAPMMGAGEAGGSQLLIDVGAVAPITIFLNGLAGTGAMGFQPGVFNTDAGDPAWSPFWEHFAAEWVDEEAAVPVTSQSQLDQLVADGDLILYGGVPDTDPDTFVVNCSVPILAPVTWEPSE